MYSEKDKNIKLDLILFDSYIQAIKNGVGSNLFRNLYADINGSKKDILKDGGLACPTFVTSILYLFKLSSDVHATVDGSIRDITAFGWYEIDQPKPGAVLIWEANTTEDQDGDIYLNHRHIGFYIGSDQAISNNARSRCPTIHHWTFGVKNDEPVRKIEKMYWNDKLN